MFDDRRENFIQKAIYDFEMVLREQMDRVDRMKDGGDFPYCNIEKGVTIGLIGGDGIGPVIMRESERLLRKILADEITSGRVTLKIIEGLTIEKRMALGKSVPDDVLAEIKACDVLLKGPTTTPKGGNLGSANVTLRRELDLYANVRPVSVPDEGIDWTFFRENTEGEYVLGSRGIEIPGRLTMDFKVTTEPGTRRIARAAFDFARANGKTKVAIVTKANIMKKTDGSFSRICHEIAAEYPGIEAEDWYIDIMTANLANKDIRNQFQVFVLPNLYGDIITDEAAQIQGGVGTAGSANLGSKYAMFEAIHGSAPRMVEAGLAEYANPSSMFKAVEMMIRQIGFVQKADRLADALYVCGEKEKKIVVTGTADGAKCSEFADYVMSKL